MKKLLQEIKEAKIIRIMWPAFLSTVWNLFLAISYGEMWHYFLLGITSTFSVGFTAFLIVRHRWHKKVMQDMEDTHQRLMSSLEGIHSHLRLIPGGGEEDEISEPPTIH